MHYLIARYTLGRITYCYPITRYTLRRITHCYILSLTGYILRRITLSYNNMHSGEDHILLRIILTRYRIRYCYGAEKASAQVRSEAGGGNSIRSTNNPTAFYIHLWVKRPTMLSFLLQYGIQIQIQIQIQMSKS